MMVLWTGWRTNGNSVTRDGQRHLQGMERNQLGSKINLGVF